MIFKKFLEALGILTPQLTLDEALVLLAIGANPNSDESMILGAIREGMISPDRVIKAVQSLRKYGLIWIHPTPGYYEQTAKGDRMAQSLIEAVK
jgi:hypothetical protein